MHFKRLHKFSCSESGPVSRQSPIQHLMHMHTRVEEKMTGKSQRLCLQPKPTEWLQGSVIGSGSFGTVHLAMDTTTGSLFVVKSANSKGGIESLKNEADLLKNCDSPHIIKCMGKDVSRLANGETKCNLFFEYMAGGSLLDVTQKFGGLLNEKVIRLYTREILKGLMYLHQNRIVHCDVKCKNILLDASGAVKLADFGCAKRLSYDDDNDKTSSKGIGGTPLWMAPEMVRNEELTFGADIWSLGCTVIEMATGRPPWGGDVLNPMATLLRIAKGEDLPEFPRHFSAEGRDFLAKCLERDPRKRWTTKELLDHPFVAYDMCLRKGDALSPTSVLDVGSYDYDNSDDDDGDGDGDGDEFVSRISFLMKCRLEGKVLQQIESDNLLEASGSWITVRSRQ